MQWLEIGTRLIADGLDMIVSKAGAVAAILAGVGLVAVYTVNFFKDVVPIRRNWQLAWMTDWIARQKSIVEAGALMRRLDLSALAPPHALIGDLVELATAGDRDALFDQPIEKLAGLANAALGMAMENPARYAPMIAVFAHRADANDLATVLSAADGGDEEVARQAAIARNRVAATIQRSLDGVVVAVSSQWERLMRMWAVGTSTAIIMLAAGLSGAIGSAGDLLLWTVGGIVGGLVAPAINDFSKSLSLLGRR